MKRRAPQRAQPSDGPVWRALDAASFPGWLRPPLAAALALLTLAGCGGSSSSATAPATTFSVTIQNETLVAVARDICHVRGTAQNTTDTPLDLNMHWRALDMSGKVIGGTGLAVSALRPGEVRTFESSGFFDSINGLIPCSSITTFQRTSTTTTPH